MMKIGTIIIAVIGVLILFDTDYFYYASMSQYFLFCIAAIILFVIGFTRFLNNSSHTYSGIELVFLTWFIFIIIRGITTNNEQYRLLYLICCYLMFQGITWLMREKRISMQSIKSLLIGLSTIESVVCIFQWFGILESNIPLFKVSGTWDSPNVTAMFIALSQPLLIEKLLHSQNKSKLILVLLIILNLAALLTINCRTAYIGLAASCIIQYSIHLEYLKKIKRMHHWKIITLGIFFLTFCTWGLYELYKMKQPSADGRIFIWKTSLSMIANKPIKGYGYGMFEKEYYLKQNEYLLQEESTAIERKNARHVFMCYNDFLEQAIEGGILSAVLYLSILIIALRCSIRQTEYISMFIIGNAIWMSTVNFFTQAVPLMFILLLFLAYVASNSNVRTIRKKYLIHCTALFGVAVFLICTLSLVRKFNVQRAIKQSVIIRKQDLHEALHIMEKQEKNAETSECFWRIYGKLLLQAKDYKRAQFVLEQARKYTSNPSVLKDLERCKQLQSDINTN